MKSYDLAVGGLWWIDLERIEELYPGYELVGYETEDGHHYTAYLRRKGFRRR